MGGRHTRLRAGNGQVDVSQTTTDSPLLPVEQIAQLQQIAPSRVDWVFEQTQIESAARRSETKRINTMVFAERILGLVFALLIAVAGLGVATYLAMNSHDWVAGVIGGATLVGLVTAFIAGKKSDQKS
jgi:uncharacterized membrane protein